MTSVVLGLVLEGAGDARTIPGLTDRVLLHCVPSIETKLDSRRVFRGVEERHTFLAWKHVDKASKGKVPRKHGYFGGKPAIEDARTAWYALQCFVGQDPKPVAVLLVRDSDGKQMDRVAGLEQARNEGAWPFRVLIGVAHTMRECWLLAGFVPTNDDEKDRLANLRKELGFDPTVRSHELDAAKETAKRSPKRVLSRLTKDDHAREVRCWSDPDLEHLRARGESNGLSAFMTEVETLVPLLPLDE